MNGYDLNLDSYELDFVQKEEQDKRLDSLFEEIEGLSDDRKARLLTKLLGKNLSVVIGNAHNNHVMQNHVMQAEIVLQLNGIFPELVKILVEALAARIRDRD